MRLPVAAAALPMLLSMLGGAGVGLSGGVAWADDAPQDITLECLPCALSPGKGKPAVNLKVIYQICRQGGACEAPAAPTVKMVPFGDELTVTGVDIGGKPPVSLPEPVYIEPYTIVADTSSDINGDGYLDFSLLTSAGNAGSAGFWLLYNPTSGGMDLLTIAGGKPEEGDITSVPMVDEAGRVTSYVRVSAISGVETTYDIKGTVAVPVSQTSTDMATDGSLVEEVTDLRGKQPKVVRSTVVGFAEDGPAYRAFLDKAQAAQKKALAAFKAGDAKGAVAVLAPLLDPLTALDSLFLDTPKAASILNDYGFFLTEAGKPQAAIPVLEAVITAKPDRVTAYLNLADALAATGDAATAQDNYRQYADMMKASGKAVPERVRALLDGH